MGVLLLAVLVVPLLFGLGAYHKTPDYWKLLHVGPCNVVLLWVCTDFLVRTSSIEPKETIVKGPRYIIHHQHHLPGLLEVSRNHTIYNILYILLGILLLKGLYSRPAASGSDLLRLFGSLKLVTPIHSWLPQLTPYTTTYYHHLLLWASF